MERGSPEWMLRALRRQRREVQQMINDMRWWNTHRLDAMPFDFGAELVLLSHFDKSIAAAERGDIAERDLHFEKIVKLYKTICKGDE